jgi:hypothetical protein
MLHSFSSFLQGHELCLKPAQAGAVESKIFTDCHLPAILHLQGYGLGSKPAQAV